MLLRGRKGNARAFPDGLIRSLPWALAAGTGRRLLFVVWIRLSTTIKACAVSKTQLDKLDLCLSGIRHIASKFILSPSSLPCLGDRKGVGFSRLNWYIGGDSPSVKVNKISSSISERKRNRVVVLRFDFR